MSTYLPNVAVDELQQLISHRRVIRHALEPKGFMLRYRHIHVEPFRFFGLGFIHGGCRHFLRGAGVATHQATHSRSSTALAKRSASRRIPELPELTGLAPVAIDIG